MKSSYDLLINPLNLFNNLEEVSEFVEIESTLEDLYCFLKVCEENECYEYCEKILEKINKKRNLS